MHTWCMFKIRSYDNIKNKKNSFSQFRQHVIKQTFEFRTNWIYCGQLRGLQSSNGHKTNIHMLIIIKWELHATHHRQHEELFKVPLIQPRRLGNSNRYSTVITEVRLNYSKHLIYYICICSETMRNACYVLVSSTSFNSWRNFSYYFWILDFFIVLFTPAFSIL